MSRPPSFEQLVAEAVRQAVREELDQVLAAVRDMVAAAGKPEPKSVTLTEAAARHQVSERTLERRIKSGELPSIRVGRRLLIPVAALDEYFSDQRRAS